MIEKLDTVLADLSQYYLAGEWDKLQAKIDGLALDKYKGEHKIDPRVNFYIVVFLSREEDGAPRLIRFAWHKPMPDPYAARIPGKKEIFEIVLGAGVDLELRTAYLSTEIENPLLAEIPRVVKKIEPILIDIIDKAGEPKKSIAANFKVRRVALPYARAKIKITDIALLSEAVVNSLPDEAGASRSRELKASFDFENIPLERFSFGLISAYMLAKDYADERIRLTDDGYYAAHPPENPLTAAILNIHPIPYDSESAKMTLAERFRLFTGIVLNPDMGACAGVGFALIRGLSVNAGLALMGIPTINNPQTLVVSGREKTLPGNPREPFRTKWRTAAFFGLGYNF